MNFEPQKFFIGLIDLFSVWLPGALLTYFFGALIGILDPAAMAIGDWAIFLVTSYLAGHFIFLVGSWLDTPVYDQLRHGTSHHQIDRLARGERLSPKLVRLFADRTFARFDGALRQAERLRDQRLKAVGAEGVINAFQWCKVKLTLEHPATLTEIERLEADSKFFRSFCVILGLLAILTAGTMIAVGTGLWTGLVIDWRESVGLLAIGIFVFLFALWRYAERRNKATTQAYWLVLGLAGPESAPPGPRPVAPTAPTHAGGVVLRKAGSGFEYLRVQALESWQAEAEATLRDEAAEARKWVLPKGHIEPGEAPERTAVREVLEEAAVWARIRDDLGTFPFVGSTPPVRVRFFVMEYLGPAPRRKPARHPWLRARLPRKDEPRRVDWQPVEEVQDLDKESQDAVKAASAYLRRTED